MDLQLLQAAGVAAGLGLFGQGLRAVVGLKKQADESAAAGQPAFAGFELGRFALSLLIGALAGVAAWMGLYFMVSPEAGDLSKGGALFAVLLAGYSGADFIEGFVKRNGK